MKTLDNLGEGIRLFFRHSVVLKIAAVCVLLGVVCFLLCFIQGSSMVWGTIGFFLAAVFFLALHFKVKLRYPMLLWIGFFLLGLAFFSLMFMSWGKLFTYLFPLYLLGLGIALLVGDPHKITLTLRSRIGKGQ